MTAFNGKYVVIENKYIIDLYFAKSQKRLRGFLSCKQLKNIS